MYAAESNHMDAAAWARAYVEADLNCLTGPGLAVQEGARTCTPSHQWGELMR